MVRAHGLRHCCMLISGTAVCPTWLLLQAGSNAPAMGMEGVPANMYNLQLQYGQTGTMPNGFTPQLGAGFQQQQQQQYLAQQYQPDMTGGMYAGQMAAAQGM